MTKICSACSVEKDSESFSRKQWLQKASRRRCKDCLADCSCTETISNEQSTNNRNKKQTLLVSPNIKDKVSVDENGNLVLQIGENEVFQVPSDVLKRPLWCHVCRKHCAVTSFSALEIDKSDDESRRCMTCAEHCFMREPKTPVISETETKQADDAMIERIKSLAVGGEKDTWKSDLESKGIKFGNMKTPAQVERQVFLIKNHHFFAGFAAANYKRDGKGAVFVFSRIAFDDLVTSKVNNVKQLDRQMMLVWGSQKQKQKVEPGFTARELYSFSDDYKALSLSMDACSEESFTLVLCCDPKGDGMIPEKLARMLRPARLASHTLLKEYEMKTQLSMICTLRFLVYAEMLKLGTSYGFSQPSVPCLNLDRDHDDPNVD